jgi:hypothetical protein
MRGLETYRGLVAKHLEKFIAASDGDVRQGTIKMI